MLFMTDVSHWWDYLTQWDMLATTSVKTYRGDKVIDRHYRKTFEPKLVTQCIYSIFLF